MIGAAVSLVVWLVTCASTTGAINLVDPSSITRVTDTITFGESPLLSTNPSYNFSGVQEYGDLTISFGSKFVGQTLGTSANSLSNSTPSGTLALDLAAPQVLTVFDLANPSAIGLGGVQANAFCGGDKYLSTPLSMQFDQGVSSVGFNIGHLDAAGTVIIEAYDSAGNSLGTVTNNSSGFDSLGIVDSSGENVIAGVSVFVEDSDMRCFEMDGDWEGFTLDDVFVGVTDEEPDGDDEEVDSEFEEKDDDQPPGETPDDGTPPDDDNTPPDDDNTPPDDDGSPPEDDGTPPEDDGTPPDDDNTPPEDDGTPPEDDGSPPDDDGSPPEDDNTPPEDDDSPPNNDDDTTPWTDDPLPDDDDTLPPPDETVPDVDDTVPDFDDSPNPDGGGPIDDQMPEPGSFAIWVLLTCGALLHRRRFHR